MAKKRSAWVRVLVVILCVLLVLPVALYWAGGDRALATASGLAAHNLCAAVFTQHQDADATFRELVVPLVGPAAPWLRYQVDHPEKMVIASVAGKFPARAAWTEGYGCRLLYGPHPQLAPVHDGSPPTVDGFAPADVVAPADPRLAAALDREFTDAPDEAARRVKAVVIVKNGKVVAERYAPGFTVDTPLLSYSVAKSFTNAFLGILVRQGRVRVDQPVGAPEWAAPDDPRGQLTFNDLLRMQSGLDAPETDTGFDPASQMLYTHDDMAGFVASRPLGRPPGTQWRYTSANTLIIDRALGQIVGGGAPAFRQFAHAELFEPLHMEGVTMEFDGTGVFQGSAHVYAPARAFARFGQLYLDDGVARDGRRILPAGWVAYSRASTLGSPYGAGFWTLDGPSDQAASLVKQGFPKDGFYASGTRGQRIYLSPSEHLVMVRLGYSGGWDQGTHEDMRLLSTAIAVLKDAH